MSRSFLRPFIAAALLSLSFASLGQAAELRAREWTPRTVLLRLAIELLAKHGCSIDPHGLCTASSSERGCSIDPNGACLPAERGCGIDPNGLCASSPSKHGCGIDPNGVCRPPASVSTPETERGCGIDPHGACIDG